MNENDKAVDRVTVARLVVAAVEAQTSALARDFTAKTEALRGELSKMLEAVVASAVDKAVDEIMATLSAMPPPPAGPKGEQGERGPAGPSGVLDAIQPWVGGGVTYRRGNLTAHNGGVWQALWENSGIEPTPDAKAWLLVVDGLAAVSSHKATTGEIVYALHTASGEAVYTDDLRGPRGEQGPPGSDGKDAVPITVGGVWDSKGTYPQLCIVVKNNSSWISKRPTSDEPGMSSDWLLLAGRGPSGKNGVDGKRGEKGERGERGPKGVDGKNGKDGKDALAALAHKSTSWPTEADIQEGSWRLWKNTTTGALRLYANDFGVIRHVDFK